MESDQKKRGYLSWVVASALVLCIVILLILYGSDIAQSFTSSTDMVKNAGSNGGDIKNWSPPIFQDGDTDKVE